jgi:2-polyprenyl-6-methoxyphenol hydroxylase-like FAD-dependent oxidoreductase
MTIAVVGAGPAGLAIALMLARQRRRVVVFERFDAPRPIGAGFMLQPTGLDVLDGLGLTDAIAALGQPVHRLFGREARRGRIVLDVRYDALNRPRPALGVLRSALFQTLYDACLAEGIDFQPSHEIVSADDGRPVDADGRDLGRFDLVIDASGARSRIARDLPARGPFGARRDLAWGAVWTTTPWPTGAGFDDSALEQTYRAADRMIGVLPSGRRPGETTPTATFFWSLKADDHARWKAEGLDAWKAEVLSLWPRTAPVLDAITDPEALTLARYGHHTLHRPVGPRLAVIGDAAHSTSPQLGQGVNMALLDAQALATALERSRDLDTALAAYARARRLHLALYQALSLAFTPFYQADGRILPWVRDHILGHVARAPMADRLLAATVSGLLLDPRRTPREPA